jgi:hypothetical protein
MPSNYYLPETDSPIPAQQLSELSNSDQVEVMRDWFFRHFEDPAESTPHVSSEGGYQYLWGGPYDAENELEAEFSGVVSESAHKQLCDELLELGYEWARKPNEESYGNYYYGVMAANTEFHGTLTDSLDGIRSLLESSSLNEHADLLCKMLHVHVITALETFLSDAFVNTVVGNEQLTRTFVKTNADFKKQKFTLDEIFDRIDTIEEEVKSYLLSLVWHNLARVSVLYENTLDAGFASDYPELHQAVATRHDIVHRSGKTKDGREVNVTRSSLLSLMEAVRRLADYVDSVFGVKTVTRLRLDTPATHQGVATGVICSRGEQEQTHAAPPPPIC